jgi:putative PIG3 family NAD(P)H quinone oxidoreductase
MRDLPRDMLAIDPEAPGGPEVLVPVRRSVPAPGKGEVLIEVAAAGVNRPDVLQRMGLYPPPPGAPRILGLEVAGVIVAVGECADRFQVGEPVSALVAGGGYAEYVTAPEGQCIALPAGMSMTDAASLPETYFTVWSNLFERGFAVEGETVLVHGGTSGIGTTTIQLCKAYDIPVIVTCGSDEKCDAALAIGADHAINYRTADFVDAVNAITEGKGVDVVLDMVGGDYLARNVKCLASGGRHVSIAFQRGATGELDLMAVMRRGLMLTGSMLRPRSVEFKALIADSLARDVWPLFEGGALRPVVDSVFPLSRAADAHRRMEAGEHVGKIVLEVR